MYFNQSVFFRVFSAYLILLEFTNGQKGRSCQLEGLWSPGVCTPFDVCMSARVAAGRGVLPQICPNSPVLNPLVCCKEPSCPTLPQGTVNIQKTGIKAMDYCVSLAEKAYPCVETVDGWARGDMCPADPTRKPADGQISKGDFPHLAVIGYGDSESTEWLASGALISDRWVISEAYALQDHGGAKRARLGGFDTSIHVDSANIYTIVSVRNHPDHTYAKIYNDIGLAQLDRVVHFSKLIFPVCLHVHTGSPPRMDHLTYLSRDGLFYHKANVMVLPHPECDNLYRPTFSEGIRIDSQMCVQRSNSKSLKGGSGAPLQVPNGGQVGCTQLLIAIHSVQHEATSRYALAARVAPFILWIESVVWP